MIDDLLHDFESWKTQQMLGMHSKQAEIWERSAAAKEELAADLDELKGKIEYHEGEIMKVKIACSGAEALVAKRLDELEAARKSAGAAFRLSDTASLSFRPQAGPPCAPPLSHHPSCCFILPPPADAVRG